MSRENLPYRKNCEGYLLCNGKVIARNTGQGYVVFPGGGVDEGETPKEALTREAMEETGAIIDGELKELGVIHFDWDENWAKTDKQKERYQKFRGEEMHLFSGEVTQMVEPTNPEDAWPDEPTMSIQQAINIIKSEPFSKSMEEYRNAQLAALESLKS